MYNDACKCEGNAVPDPTEPMKAIILELNDILGETRNKARCIEESLFGVTQTVQCNEKDITCMHDALMALRSTAKETAQILYSINDRING